MCSILCFAFCCAQFVLLCFPLFRRHRGRHGSVWFGLVQCRCLLSTYLLLYTSRGGDSSVGAGSSVTVVLDFCLFVLHSLRNIYFSLFLVAPFNSFFACVVLFGTILSLFNASCLSFIIFNLLLLSCVSILQYPLSLQWLFLAFILFFFLFFFRCCCCFWYCCCCCCSSSFSSSSSSNDHCHFLLLAAM